MMIQTDRDDFDIIDPVITELSYPIAMKFIESVRDIGPTIISEGEPAFILLNDRGSVNPGKELLKQIRTEPLYKHIPVVLLGEIAGRDYIGECYRAGANSYITKPSTIAETRKKIDFFFRYWFEVTV